MQDSKSNSVNGNPFTETGIPWLRLIFFFSKFFYFVGKVVRYNTALARLRDNPDFIISQYDGCKLKIEFKRAIFSQKCSEKW